MRRWLLLCCGLFVAAFAVACGDGPRPLAVVSPTSESGGGDSTDPGGGTTVGYVEDIKPLLDADCTTCHNSRNANGRVDLTTYTSVMRTVSAGSASSTLVRVTQSGGAMYKEWRGSADTKANLVRRWVVDFQARERRE